MDHSKPGRPLGADAPADRGEERPPRLHRRAQRRRGGEPGGAAQPPARRIQRRRASEGRRKPEPRQADYVFRRPLTVEVRYRHRAAGRATSPQPLPAAPRAPPRHRHPLRGVRGGRRQRRHRHLPARHRQAPHLRRRNSSALRSGVARGAAGQGRAPDLRPGRRGPPRRRPGARGARGAPAPGRAGAEEGPPRTRIARALLAGGMGEAAREEARRAVQLEPRLAPAWRHLGWVLQHDELGRRFGPGFDRAGALAAYRKAKELDPKDAGRPRRPRHPPGARRRRHPLQPAGRPRRRHRRVQGAQEGPRRRRRSTTTSWSPWCGRGASPRPRSWRRR